jgi:hypothetical protein
MAELTQFTLQEKRKSDSSVSTIDTFNTLQEAIHFKNLFEGRDENDRFEYEIITSTDEVFS